MGAGSSASAGPGQYSLDDLLTHLSAEGVLTAAKVIATGEDMRLPLPLDYLQAQGAFEGAETPDAIIALDLDNNCCCQAWQNAIGHIIWARLGHISFHVQMI